MTTGFTPGDDYLAAAPGYRHKEVEIKVSWKGKIWDTFDLPKPERKLLFKVDAVLMTLASLGYFIKNLDQTNVNSAFLSGMKEDLGMYGNELVTSTTIWTVGYVIGQIPSNLLLTRVSPRWVIPSLELAWGIATLGSYSVKNVPALYACRFLVGLFEAGFYPGIHFILGGWYTPREIGKRATIFWTAGSLGQMFSGILQAAAYTNLSGRHGLAGWRWLFIIDAIITIPIALAGYVFYPPDPLQHEGAAPFWLTEEEFELAKDRVRRVGRVGKNKMTWKRVRALLKDWHFYMLPMIYVIWNNGYVQQPMGYWLKSFNHKPPPVPGRSYTVPQINNLPLPATAISVVVYLACAWLSDGYFKGKRWPLIYSNSVIGILFAAIILPRDLYKSNIAGTFVLYYLCNVGHGAGPLILTWINEICSNDTEKRALLVAMGNDLAYVMQAIGPNFYWKTTDFPKATKGWISTIILNALLAVWTGAVQLLLARDERRAKAQWRAANGNTPGTPPSPSSPESEDEKHAGSEKAQTPDILAATRY